MDIWDGISFKGAGHIDEPVTKDGNVYTGTIYEEERKITSYLKDGCFHRIDGPARVSAGGYEAWWVNGKLHRIGGPAIEDADGMMMWWVDGNLHRLDGPAIESRSGYCAWWVEDQEVDITAIFGYEPSVPLTAEEQIILRLAV